MLEVLKLDRKQLPDSLSILKALEFLKAPVPDEIIWENRG